MAEILAAVADVVSAVGVETVLHTGTVDEIDDDTTVFVVIPHEYYWFNPRPAPSSLRRTIAFGVEHPGTDTFAVAARAASVMGARVEISQESVTVLNGAGLTADHFQLGYSQRWDQWGGIQRERPVDLAYMGAADPERLQVLARMAPGLADIQTTDLLIPPIEQRLRPRPDFLMGAAKWRFLASTKILLNLHRQAKTALELVRALEAMCNGAVLITEPSTDMAGLEPGVHLVTAPREAIPRRIHELLQAPGLLVQISADAYTFCVEHLNMTASAERLVAIADDLIDGARLGPNASNLHMPDWPEVRPPYVPELAHWIPEPYPLPVPGATLPEPMREAVRALAIHRRQRMAIDDMYVGTPSGAEVDAVVVTHAGSGPLAATLASLAAQSVSVSVQIAGIGIPMQEQITSASTYLSCSLETSVGSARNELIERSSAPFVLILEAGDQLLGDSLATMVKQLHEHSAIDVIYPMAAYGEATLVNLFHPEPARLERFGYLTRGYLVRRDALTRIGTFSEDPVLDAYVDHDFWLRAAGAAERVTHLHRIGTFLWPTDLSKMMPADPAEVRSLFSSNLPDPLDGYEGFAVLTSAAFLLQNDERLRAYAEAMEAEPGAALIIDASQMDPTVAAAELTALVERCQLTDEKITLIGVVGKLHPSQRLRVNRASHAVYGERPAEADPTDPSSVPTFTRDALPALRTFAASWRREQLDRR